MSELTQALMVALSQTTENRKVEARKPLIFQDPIFGFYRQNPTLRQSPSASTVPSNCRCISYDKAALRSHQHQR